MRKYRFPVKHEVFRHPFSFSHYCKNFEQLHSKIFQFSKGANEIVKE